MSFNLKEDFSKAREKYCRKIRSLQAQSNDLADEKNLTEILRLQNKILRLSEKIKKTNKTEFSNLERKLNSISNQRDEPDTNSKKRHEALLSLVKQQEDIIKSQLGHMAGDVSGLDASINGIREFLSKSSETMSRYQEGYDYQILKKITKRIIRIIDTVNKMSEKAEGESKAELIDVTDDLIDLLDLNGIEMFEPKEGDAFDDETRLRAELTDNVIFTDDDSKVGKIAKVVKSGYIYYFNDDNKRTISLAKVALYAKKENKNG